MAFELNGIGAVGSVLGSSIMWLFIFMLFCGIIGGIIFLLWREMQYKYKAVVMLTDQERNDKNVKRSYIVNMRKITKKGILKLKRFKQDIEIPSPDYWQPIGKRQGVFFQYDGRELFVALNPTVNSPVTFTPAEYDVMGAMVRRKERMADRHGTVSHFQKFGHYYIFFGTVFLMVLAMYFVSNNMGEGFKEVARALQSRQADLSVAGTEVLG